MALPNKTKIPVGFVLSGKYRITREIGRGGMAAVYEAENVDIGKRVAIKVLAQELTSSAVVVERFLREARAAAAIRSPYICDVYDSGRLEDGRPFLVLELLEGESLYELMTRVRHIDVATTVEVITQTCRGLTRAHAGSIVHRDLKPENIFLAKDEEGKLLAKILDFGLAKFYAPMEGSGAQRQARLTREGAVFGTPAYMSPEQVRGQGAVDHRADLWALGCITYECLTGKTVWATEQGVAMTFAQIANAPLPRPSKLRPDLPQSFTDWFDRALDRNIDRRFQTAKEFADELALAFDKNAGISAPQLDSPRQEPIQVKANQLIELRDSGVNPRLGDAPSAMRSGQADAVTLRPRPPGGPPGGQPFGTASGPDAPSSQEADVPVVLSEPPAPHSPITGRGSKVGFVSPLKPPETSPSQSDLQRQSTASRREPRSAGSGRVVVALGAIALVASGAYAGWRQFVQPQGTDLAVNSATRETGPVESAAPVIRTGTSVPSSLPWRPLMHEAQQAIASDNLKGAQKLLSDAFEKGGHGVPRTMRDQVTAAIAGASSGPCRLTGLGRPRTYDLTAMNNKPVGAGPPAIAVGPRGALMVWTDSHEGSEHAYAVALDEALRNVSEPIDVTPEGSTIGRPQLTVAGDKFVLTYWDAKGGEAGPKVRWIDSDGRIAGPAVSIAPTKGGNFWPTLVRLSDGGFFVTWTQEVDDAEDLFLRALSSSLEPRGDIVRLTDLKVTGPKPRVRMPWLASSRDALHIVYRFDRDPLRLIQHLRLLKTDANKGLDVPRKPAQSDRTFGDSALVNTDKGKADSPAIACGPADCFIVWHGEPNAAWAAYVDPQRVQPLWRKKLSKTGAHPSIAVSSSNGQAQLAWYDRGSLLTASISRDGIGTPSKFARILGDQPASSIAPGVKPGEWYVAWLDFETGHLEPYAARVHCR